MEKKMNWDAIPSLEGLEIDWEYSIRKGADKRAYVRLNLDDIGQLFEAREIAVKVATVQQMHSGVLLDISTGGMAAQLAVALEVNQQVKVGFFLGTVRIVAKGQVRHVQRHGNGYKIGIQFVDLDTASRDFIGGLYASKVLRHAY